MLHRATNRPGPRVIRAATRMANPRQEAPCPAPPRVAWRTVGAGATAHRGGRCAMLMIRGLSSTPRPAWRPIPLRSDHPTPHENNFLNY
jgi:hypothetical protein